MTACLHTIAVDPDVEVLRVKNRLEPSFDPAQSAGYRDILLSIRISTADTRSLGVDLHVCEVQLLLRSFYLLKACVPFPHLTELFSNFPAPDATSCNLPHDCCCCVLRSFSRRRDVKYIETCARQQGWQVTRSMLATRALRCLLPTNTNQHKLTGRRFSGSQSDEGHLRYVSFRNLRSE
jgi:hypothetical protein